MSKITRRDFINGTLLAAGASLIPPSAFGNDFLNTIDPKYYPPAKTGLRGSHAGSYESAHQRAWSGKSDWGQLEVDSDEYDLVIVGAGISGLAAAHFYQKEHGTDKKILILDNHDDFGGHAKRNEHHINGQTLLAYGGSQTLQEPANYSKGTKQLLADLMVDCDQFNEFFDQNFFSDHGLESVTFFDKATFGEDKVVNYPICHYGKMMQGISDSKITAIEAVKQMPVDAEVKEQLSKILSNEIEFFHDFPVLKKLKYANSTFYFDALKKYYGATHPLVLKMLRGVGSDGADVGTDCLTAMEALYSGAPGFSMEAMKEIIGEKRFDKYILGEYKYIHHFPDGNASIARLLVRKLIPSSAKGDDMEDVVLARMKYELLDDKENSVRIRLNSTVVKVEHDGDYENAKSVKVDYIAHGKSYQVKGKKVILACYNMMIPHLVKGLPLEQAKALKNNVKTPLVYTTIGLKNWRSFKEKNIGLAYSPGSLHNMAFLDFPVSMGGYKYASSPNDPIVMNMIWMPYGDKYGTPPKEQFKEGRHKILSKSFDDFENEIKNHLGGMLSGTNFDANNDINSITVNRWSHGYAYAGTAKFDWDMEKNAKIGRKQFGRISIANSDSAATAYIYGAIDQAKRAVDEL
ncbi:MAG: FAD-dependent oxidoreductase [Flavobacteriales bacterium]|nr:FAD-dependent oxidoreductase [Flavobacteriales bacterium]